ncbi:DNA alkylation repair protein [Mucilaginibacter xinganensis]|nr:DNA alkylation repair protein [Mucilaginibacter xinganensis]
MTVSEIMAELKSFGNEKIKNILLKHGVKEPFFGVKVEHLKTIQKKIKTDYQLALDLYATGNADAMYLAGLIAADDKMTKADLQTWVKQAVSTNISEYTVPWVAAGSNYGFELAREWISADEDNIAAAGWATLGNLVALKPDDELDLPALKLLLDRAEKNIRQAGIRTQRNMNTFVVAVATYVSPLASAAAATAAQIGAVIKKPGNNAPAKKKKTVKC